MGLGILGFRDFEKEGHMDSGILRFRKGLIEEFREKQFEDLVTDCLWDLKIFLFCIFAGF